MEEVTGKALQSEEASETTEQISAAQAPEAALTAKERTHDKMHGGWMRFKREWKKDLVKNWPVYLLFIPVLVWLLIVHYIPMVGILLAWKDYDVWDGIWGSEWIGWGNFETLFTGGGTGGQDFLFALRNTVMIALLNLAFGSIVPLAFAFMITQVRFKKYKRVCQMLSYLPNFVSAVVIVQLMQNLIGYNGPITMLMTKAFGAENIDWTNVSSPAIWVWYIVFGIWQSFGFGSIMTVSAITNIDGNMYEAAAIDGANRWQMLWKITFPQILPMMITMWLLQIGLVFKTGFDRTQLLYNPTTNGEYIDTLFSFTMRNTLSNDLGIATASSLFQSVVGTILMVFGNWLSRKVAGFSMF